MTLLERDREKLEEGREEGLEEGLKKGREEGLEEGLEEGIELTKKVFKLLSKGESIATIAKICEISEEKVRKILE